MSDPGGNGRTAVGLKGDQNVNTNMRRGFVAIGVLGALALSSLPATADSPGSLDISLCSPTGHTFTTNIDNQFLPLSSATPSQPWVLVGPDPDGTTHGLQIRAIGNVPVDGVTTLEVEEFEWQDKIRDGVYDPNTEPTVEDSFNFFAQRSQSKTVCYFGEIVNGGGLGTGSWQAGINGAQPGIFMPDSPNLGMHYFEEKAPADDALDEASIVGVGGSGTVTVPFLPGTFANTIRVKEFSSIEKAGKEYKSYAPKGVGLLIDDTLQRCNPGLNCQSVALAPRR